MVCDPTQRYGAALRALWRLDPDMTYLNHGGYGATPVAVLAAQDEWRTRIERNPSGFMTGELPEALRQAASSVAAAVGAVPADLVFVANATEGINAVLRSLVFGPGDEILITSLAYPAVRKAALFVAEQSGARLVEAEIALPVADEAALVASITAHLGLRTRLAIFDHIASASGFLLPVATLAQRARHAGARVLIDGAHAPGQIPLDIPALGADWYVGNLHKWYFAPRSAGFLWAAGEGQVGLHPLAISYGLGQGFTAEFDWTGTRDFTAALAAPAGIACHQRLGGGALMARNAALARSAASYLARKFGTEISGPATLFAAMATVRLPVKGAANEMRARRLARWLAATHRIEAAIAAQSGALWLRIAAQAYNEDADYERLAKAVAGAAWP